MNRARLIPCLLIDNRGLYKTIKFDELRYLGDPINAVRIFNELNADELVIYDIGKSAADEIPNFEYLAKLATECRMPLCYGGGVKSVDHALKLVDLGIEKISFGSVIFENFDVLRAAAEKIGNQSVVVTLDVNIKKGFLKSQYILTSHNNTIEYPEIDLPEILRNLSDCGVGEIIINSVHRDGTMQGYDNKLLSLIYNRTRTPLTILGGARSLNDIKQIVAQFKYLGVGASSLFVYKGKYNAVLINYPSLKDKLEVTQF